MPVRVDRAGDRFVLTPAGAGSGYRRAGEQHVERFLVRMDRIVELRPLPSGDATVLLRSGASVTLSRGYRDQSRDRMG